MTDSFPAPALYVGQVVHARHASPHHRFAQPVLYCLLNLQTISALARKCQLFGHNQLNLFSFYDRDHGARDGSDLLDWVHGQLLQAEIPLPGGPVCLLAQPRVLGHVFNPLSVIYCHDPAGVLRAVIYEVHNTYGEAHSYVAAVSDGAGAASAGVSHTAAKTFRVSPFQPLSGAYDFALQPPGETAHLTVSLRRHSGNPLLTARLDGERRPFTDRSLMAEFLRLPLSSLRTTTAIYRHGTKIWLKSRRAARLRPRLQGPQGSSEPF